MELKKTCQQQPTTSVCEEPPTSDTMCTLTSPLHQAVEVYYDDGKWYRGIITSFNIKTGKWTVQFEEDDDTTEVMFPDKEVRFV